MARLRLIGALVLATIVGKPVMADDPSVYFRHALKSLPAKPADLAIRPERWPTPFALPIIESLLREPLTMPSRASEWSRQLWAANGSRAYIDIAAPLLHIPTLDATVSTSSTPVLCPGAPDATQQVLTPLLQALASAQQDLDRSIRSVSAHERQSALSSWRAVLTNQQATVDLNSGVAVGKKFDQTSLIAAAQKITRAIDDAIPALLGDSWIAKQSKRIRFHTALGDILISGGSSQSFSAQDLDGVALLINHSRRSRYKGAVAAASDGRIRVVIDGASDVAINTPDQEASAGSGLFGIGLLYLPDANKKLVIKTGSFSQGAGLFGVGGLFLKAPGAVLESGDAAQGLGLFGIGVLANLKGDGARYSVRFAGQGAGFTRGVGIFNQVGSSATIDGGFYYADPREPLAMTSLCQGVGYGPRAFAAGGFGLASVVGDGNVVRSSYFAQGSGYWHSVGGFFAKGNNNTFQARRYDQGAGVHTAVGLMTVDGDKNRAINWGVGPAYGWDYGIGSFTARGNDNLFQTDWGVAHGDMNGHAFALIDGDRNHVRWPNAGSGALTRQMPSYGLAVVRGQDNQLLGAVTAQTLTEDTNIFWNPWGVLALSSSTTLNPTMPKLDVSWPEPNEARAVDSDRKELSDMMARAESETLDRRVRDWAMVASSFSLDAQVPQQAFRNLIALSDYQFPALLNRLSPTRFDEYLLFPTLISARGLNVLPALQSELRSSSGTRQMMLLGLFAAIPPAEAFPVVRPLLAHSKWVIRRTTMSVLGSWMDREAGRTPGRLRLLSIVKEWLDHPTEINDRDEFDKKYKLRLGDRYLPDVLGIATLAGPPEDADRLLLLEGGTNPIDVVSMTSWWSLRAIVLKYPAVYRKAIQRELDWADEHRLAIAALIRSYTEDSDPDVVAAALAALGQVGDLSDASVIAHFLNAPASKVRESAASALAKMGSQARTVLIREQKSPDALVRKMAALAVTQSSDPATVKLSLISLNDSDPAVRTSALIGLGQVWPDPRSWKILVEDRVSGLAQNDPSATVRVAAQYLQTLLQ